ncbi:hypothetical protein M7I_4968 [Glarea lozoyensis 74030]|nr:hypothetical protein M7I_4968 [Glarea lozoyensis 74030]
MSDTLPSNAPETIAKLYRDSGLITADERTWGQFLRESHDQEACSELRDQELPEEDDTGALTFEEIQDARLNLHPANGAASGLEGYDADDEASIFDYFSRLPSPISPLARPAHVEVPAQSPPPAYDDIIITEDDEVEMLPPYSRADGPPAYPEVEPVAPPAPIVTWEEIAPPEPQENPWREAEQAAWPIVPLTANERALVEGGAFFFGLGGNADAILDPMNLQMFQQSGI